MGMFDHIWQESWAFQENTTALIFPPPRRLLWIIFKNGEGKAQNKTWIRVWGAHAVQAQGGSGWFKHAKKQPCKGVWVFTVSKSRVGMVWKRFNAHLNNFLLWRCVRKRNLPHDMGLPKWELAGTEESSKWSMGTGWVWLVPNRLMRTMKKVWALHDSQEWDGQ